MILYKKRRPSGRLNFFENVLVYSLSICFRLSSIEEIAFYPTEGNRDCPATTLLSYARFDSFREVKLSSSHSGLSCPSNSSIRVPRSYFYIIKDASFETPYLACSTALPLRQINSLPQTSKPCLLDTI